MPKSPPEAVAVDEYKPCMSVYLEGDQLPIGDMKVGKKIILVLKGRLISMTETKSLNGGVRQELSIEDPKAKLEASNYFKQAAEDDEEGVS